MSGASFSTPPLGKFTQIGEILTGAATQSNQQFALPIAYSGANTYSIVLAHTDASPGLRSSVIRNTGQLFTVYWTGGANTAQPFNYISYGS